jgi:hypothetical protein
MLYTVSLAALSISPPVSSVRHKKYTQTSVPISLFHSVGMLRVPADFYSAELMILCGPPRPTIPRSTICEQVFRYPVFR